MTKKNPSIAIDGNPSIAIDGFTEVTSKTCLTTKNTHFDSQHYANIALLTIIAPYSHRPCAQEILERKRNIQAHTAFVNSYCKTIRIALSLPEAEGDEKETVNRNMHFGVQKRSVQKQ